MIKREYYSVRKGLIPQSAEVDFQVLKKLFLIIYKKLESEGYFQKYFGFYCVDQGEIYGELGDDINTMLFINLRKSNLWSIVEKLEYYSEDDFFDILEFLHDHCASPVEREYHDWNQCGWHVSKSDDVKGALEFRDAINPILRTYKNGFEISSDGQILSLPDMGLESLLQAEIPTSAVENVRGRIEAAILKFRRAKSSEDDRRDALRDLADVLEYLRPQVKSLLTRPDEIDLFNIANNFGIRHHNPKQKTDYDKAAYHSWIFYSYLSTIHLILRLVKKESKSA